ncbi:MAG: gamma-glutamylcyclotransferase [Halieaceae bacterium]|jgi:glutathione-specific gamma-glutamylcyclotransferase|nr:gamma-glutamylcyclotransferase [Halieaceae bacterium]
MSFDTSQENKSRLSLHSYDEIWIFGYGSLIYKVDFPILDRKPASIKGWQRRFWQGSHDHRGTPESPGRVLTLIEEGDSECAGVAYRVSHDVFEHLDYREKNGYLRHEIDIHFDQSNLGDLEEPEIKAGMVYIGFDNNAAYLGPASEQEIAQQIHHSIGPSGRNDDYVFQLVDSLRALGDVDEHVFAIEFWLKELAKK